MRLVVAELRPAEAASAGVRRAVALDVLLFFGFAGSLALVDVVAGL